MKKLDFLKVSFNLRKDRIENGIGPIYLLLFLDGKRTKISINQTCHSDQWDEKNGRYLGNSAKASSFNEMLEKIRLDTIRVYNEMRHFESDITVDMLREKLTTTSVDRKKKLLEVCDIYNSNTKKLVGIEMNKETWARYSAYRNRIGDFIGQQFKINDVYFVHLKYSFIVEYEFYLKTEVKLHQNTMVKYLQYLSRVSEFAVNNEWTERNLFQNYKCPVKETKREYLNADELERIRNKEIILPRLEEVRDVFIFCCYTGYAYKDAESLTPEHIGTGINGRKWIYTSRQKTDNVSNVPLLAPALDIIEKYKEHPSCINKNRILPMKSNQKLNAYLKEIADVCGITKPMTMHIARHTFATTVLLSNGVSMEATSKMLGHSSLKTTQIYGKILESRVAAEMDLLSQKLEAKPIDAVKQAK